jgi:hypothetical protein
MISGKTSCAPQLVTVPGAVIPYPYGGKQRQAFSEELSKCFTR